MALGTDVAITHKFVSGKADGADPTLVQPSKWNQNENLGQGSDGQIIVRDSSQADGGSWVDAGADSCVRGLVGINNAGTPNTKYDLSANLVVLRHPTLGYGRTQVNTGVITNDTGLAGPAANGRDQAGAFGASTWIHFYFIWGNGQALATISSLVAPTTGPTLPANYTHWAYAGAVRFNGSSQLIGTHFRGSKAFYGPQQNALNAGNATVETAVSLAALIPPNALRFGAEFQFINVTNAAANVKFRFISGQDHFSLAQTTTATNAGNADAYAELPNAGQQVFYINSGAGDSSTINIMNYTMPNGGE